MFRSVQLKQRWRRQLESCPGPPSSLSANLSPDPVQTMPTSLRCTNQNTCHYTAAAWAGQGERSGEEGNTKREGGGGATRTETPCWAVEKAKVIKRCVVYVDHPLSFCLVFCIVFIAMTLLTALPPPSSAFKQNPFTGTETGLQRHRSCGHCWLWSLTRASSDWEIQPTGF